MKSLRLFCGVMVLGTALLSAGCDSKPEADTNPPPPPPSGHEKYSVQTQKMTTPGTGPASTPATEPAK